MGYILVGGGGGGGNSHWYCFLYIYNHILIKENLMVFFLIVLFQIYKDLAISTKNEVFLYCYVHPHCKGLQ